MPHLRIEYSANLEGMVDLSLLCRNVHDAILNAGPFELGAIRVRAFKADYVAIADLLPNNGFLDMTLRIGAGRTQDEKKAAGDAILAAAEQTLATLLAQPHFALSLDIVEIDPGLSWKKNAMHQRLRNR